MGHESQTSSSTNFSNSHLWDLVEWGETLDGGHKVTSPVGQR